MYPSQNRAPTVEEFRSIFKSSILGLQEVGGLEIEQQVQNVFEIKQVECASDVQQL